MDLEAWMPKTVEPRLVACTGTLARFQSGFLFFEDVHCIFPQTELAMRGSYGVAKEGGYELFVDPVAPAPEHFVL